jgi:D-threitol dehydrogenase (NAD+)
MFDLTGRVIVVTGAARGLGAALAGALARAGARLAVLDILPIGSPGPDHIALTCDVRDSAQVSAALDAVVARFGRIDGLVNNAATYSEVADRDSFRTCFETNTWGAHVCALAAADRMQRGGSIVNLGTNVGEHYGVTDDMLFYIASKAALLSIQRSLAIQLGPAGVRINTVSPGPTRVDGGYYSPSLLDLFDRIAPLGIDTGADQVCAAVQYLLSDATANVTGTNIVVDGGFVTGYSLAAMEAVIRSQT